MNGADVFKGVPYLTEDNFEQVLPDTVSGKFSKGQFFDAACRCVNIIKKKYAGVVTGLWIRSTPTADGGLTALVRTKEDVGDKKFELHSDIGDFLRHEYLWRFSDMEELDDIPVQEWIDRGVLYALYDSTRG